MTTNKMWCLAARPAAAPTESDFESREAPARPPDDGEVLAETLWLSVDPYMRGRMRDGASYVAPAALGEPMVGGGVGRVLQSRAEGLSEGDIVESMSWGWQTHPTLAAKGLRKVDTSLAPISTALGVLGMPGMTAYFGLVEAGQPRDGETLLVSAASGAVGALVGQIGLIKGCRVVGIAGGERKCAYLLDDLGFDAAIDYRATDDLRAAIGKACPDGVDVFFDNVGGATLDAALANISVAARIVICGMISEYNLDRAELAPRPTRHLLVKRARMQGIIVTDWFSRWDDGRAQMAEWIASGELRYREDVLDGFDQMPAAFMRLFSGANFGKQLVRIADE